MFQQVRATARPILVAVTAVFLVAGAAFAGQALVSPDRTARSANSDGNGAIDAQPVDFLGAPATDTPEAMGPEDSAEPAESAEPSEDVSEDHQGAEQDDHGTTSADEDESAEDQDADEQGEQNDQGEHATETHDDHGGDSGSGDHDGADD